MSKAPSARQARRWCSALANLCAKATAKYAGNRIIAQVLAVAAGEKVRVTKFRSTMNWHARRRSSRRLALSERAALLLGDHDVADESTQYRQWVYDAARATAAATKSGGFLGIGAEDISESEEEFLSQLRNALGLNTSHD